MARFQTRKQNQLRSSGYGNPDEGKQKTHIFFHLWMSTSKPVIVDHYSSVVNISKNVWAAHVSNVLQEHKTEEE